jgi:transposase
LLLSEEQRSTLQGWMRRRKTAQALSMRARIVLRASEGLTATAIAAEVHVCIQTVSKWWRRFDEQGLDGLLDEPRPGQPRKLSDRQIEQVIVRTLESKPPAATHWSTRMMAEASGINQTAIDTIEKNVPEDMDIHLILDNYGTHKTLMIRNWLAKRPASMSTSRPPRPHG